MLLEDAYLYMFNILNEYYDKHKKSDSLASILSDMDPYIFQDRKPADPATYTDWKMIVKPFMHNGRLEEADLILALKSFLVYYQQEFGYDLESVITYVGNIVI